MKKEEILAEFPIAGLFSDFIAFINANPVEDNVSEDKAELLALVYAAQNICGKSNTPKYNVFLSVYEYVRIRIDGNICQNYPKLCGFYRARVGVVTAFDFGVFD